jgi:hypothetical protein
MVNPLDELSDALGDAWHRGCDADPNDTWGEISLTLSEFKADHPGIIDTTTECENCHGKFARSGVRVISTSGPTGAHYQATLCAHCADTLDMYEWYGFTRRA